MTRSAAVVLAISHDNLMVHCGPAVDLIAHVGVAAHNPPIAAPAPTRPPMLLRRTTGGAPLTGRPLGGPMLEYFDIHGEGLGAPRGGAFAPLAAGEPVDLKARRRILLARIDEGLDNLQRALDENPELGNRGPGLPPLLAVPRPTGSYRDVVTELADWFFPLNPQIHLNRGNWFHNLWHAATGT